MAHNADRLPTLKALLRQKSSKQIALFGAGNLGRSVGRELDGLEFQFVDDTPEKQGTIIDGKAVVSLRDFANAVDPNSALIVVCIYQPGHSFQRTKHRLWTEFGLSCVSFADILAESENSLLPFMFFESRVALSRKAPDYDILRAALADEASRQTLDGHLVLRRTGQFGDLVIADRFSIPQLDSSLAEGVEFVDCGAFDGRVALEFARYRAGRFAKLTVIEPDSFNSEKIPDKLKKAGIPRSKISIQNCAICGFKGKARFDAHGNMASALSMAGGSIVECRLLEDFESHGEQFFHLDIEGAEVAALKASIDFLRRHRPTLAISVYHQPNDLLDVHRIVHENVGGYECYLRCHGEDGEDLMLYCLRQ